MGGRARGRARGRGGGGGGGGGGGARAEVEALLEEGDVNLAREREQADGVAIDLSDERAVRLVLRLDELGDEKLAVTLGEDLGLRVEDGDEVVVVLDARLADEQVGQVQPARARVRAHCRLLLLRRRERLQRVEGVAQRREELHVARQQEEQGVDVGERGERRPQDVLEHLALAQRVGEEEREERRVRLGELGVAERAVQPLGPRDGVDLGRERREVVECRVPDHRPLLVHRRDPERRVLDHVGHIDVPEPLGDLLRLLADQRLDARLVVELGAADEDAAGRRHRGSGLRQQRRAVTAHKTPTPTRRPTTPTTSRRCSKMWTSTWTDAGRRRA